MEVKQIKKNSETKKTGKKAQLTPPNGHVTEQTRNGKEEKVYNQEGKEVSTIKLPEKVFAIPWNADLVHQVVTSMLLNARRPIAHAKDRSEVSGGGKKPWRQKGTGRARHGSIRSPLWIHGGVTHGPRKEKSYEKKINRKMRIKALFAVLSQKLKDGEILFVNSIAVSKPSTKSAKEILTYLKDIKGFEKLVSKRKNVAYMAFPELKDEVMKSFRNINNISVHSASDLNAADALSYKRIVIVEPEAVFKQLEAKLSK